MWVPRPWLLAAAALLLAGCDSKPQTFTIGVIAPRSGTAATRGTDLLNGAQLAADEINAADFRVKGKPLAIHISSSDDKGDVQTAVSNARALLDSGVDAIIGPLNSNQAAAVIPLLATKGVPVLTTATSTKLVGMGSGNVLRLLANDDQQGRALASFAVDTLHAQRIVTVVERSDYGHGLQASVGAALSRHQLAPLASVEVGDTESVSDAMLARLHDARPDTVLFLAREPQLVSLLDAMDKSGWTDVTLLGSNVIRNKNVARRPVHVRALYATATAIDAREFPDGATFLAAFRKRFGGDPVWGAQYAYDAVYALADAARQSQSLDGPDLVTTLKRIEPITRVNQQMRFADSGEQVYPNIAVYKSEGGSWLMQLMSATW